MKTALFLPFILILTSCWAPSPEEVPHKADVVNSMIESLKKQHPNSPGLNANELTEMLKDQTSLQLVDVRSPQEREVSTIAGAISKEEFSKAGAKSNQQLVVAYDTFGYRAIEWLKKQKDDGLKNALFLEGGVIAWAHAQGPFVDDQGQPTQKVHVLNEAWALLPDSYEAISE